MRALLPALTLLLALLPGCDKPAPSDYWAGGPKAAAVAGNFEKLMAQGTRANLAGRPAEAEARFREALSEQRKLRGNDSPLLGLPLMSLALQLSAQGQFPQADAQFDEADRVLKSSTDKAMKARLRHYRGVHLLNEKKPADAEPILGAAQAAYTALLPAEVLTRAPIVRPVRNRFDVNAKVATATGFKLANNDPSIQPSLLGLIEVLRYRAIALRDLGKPSEADGLTTFAARVASANDLGRPSVFARVFRTAGVTAAGESQQVRALSDLGRSDTDFEVALPGTKPAAEAGLIHAGELMRAGSTGAALSICRRAVATLVKVDAGTSPELMAPCLDAYASGGTFGFLSSNLAEMFLAAQVAQGTITSHQIAQASASLAENARDPKIGAALKQRDQLQREIDRIYRALDTIGAAGASGRAGEQVAQLQQQADQVQAALSRAEAEVRTLSPNYGQLVQDVVPASAVFAALHPNEAFVALFLSKTDGWAFALRDGNIAISKIEGGIGKVGPLVTAIRAGIEKTQVSALPTFDIDDARRLYDITLGGVAAATKGATSLVIAPTGPLLSLPFEVLLTGPAELGKLATAPWLLRQATITHVPAATNFVSLRKVANSSQASKQWFGFGDFRPVSVAQAQRSFPVGPCGDSGRLLAALPALPGAVKELENARAVLSAAASDELTGEAFTADQVLKRSLKDYRILHFAAHALLPTDLRCQTEAAIVTSPPSGAPDAGGALLSASKLLGLDLDANLVILSACNSGGPGGGAGESLSGLARSFFFAKARSLLVTHWEVSDQVAALLVVLTINDVKEKPAEGVTGALREAQLSILDRAATGKLPAEIAHPFFWAPFAVIGDGGEGGARSAVSSRL
jgi:CHAT domain-containing protein